MRFCFHEARFIEYSTIESNHCDNCRILTLVQDIPAEVNAGEYFSVRLCRECLLKLAQELPGDFKNDL